MITDLLIFFPRVSPFDLYKKELTIVGTAINTNLSIQQSIEMLAAMGDKYVQVERMIYNMISLWITLTHSWFNFFYNLCCTGILLSINWTCMSLLWKISNQPWQIWMIESTLKSFLKCKCRYLLITGYFATRPPFSCWKYFTFCNFFVEFIEFF